MENALRQLSFPEIYERALVPAIFAPWARDLIERARPFGPSDRVLDLGCGTGIVSRLVRERLGGATRIVGLDANAQMIAAARTLAPELEFREGNAMALPFDAGAFDIVLCQEMLQFVPDRPAALREIRRVLPPGGRLVASTWRPRREHALHDALGVVAERHFSGPTNDKRYALAGETLRAELLEAGFTAVEVETVTLVEHFKEPFPIRANVMAMGFDLSALSDDDRERRLAVVEADSAAVFARFAAEGGGFAAPASANIARAVAP